MRRFNLISERIAAADGGAPAFEAFLSRAPHGDDECPAVSSPTVLPEVDRLPAAQRQLAARHRHVLRRLRQRGADVRRHVIETLGVVLVIGALRRDARKEPLQIAPHSALPTTGILKSSSFARNLGRRPAFRIAYAFARGSR